MHVRETSGGKNKYEKPHIKYEICTDKINPRQKSILLCIYIYIYLHVSLSE